MNLQEQLELVAERVARGAALLDKEVPGWEQDVDPTLLVMDDACNCILGQVGQNAYGTGLRMVGLTPSAHEHPTEAFRRQVEHGFDVSADCPYDFEELQVEWDTLLETRGIAQ